MIYECTNAYYFRHINEIGGIESHLFYIATKYAKDYEIYVFYKTGDYKQIKRLREHVNVIRLEDNDTILCENIFCCFNREVLNQVKAKTKYLVLHGDYKDMVKRGQLVKKELPIDSRIDKYIGVSKLVCDSWKEITGIDCENVYEPVVIPEHDRPLLFISATRLTQEKGFERMKKLANYLNENQVNYLWLVYTNSPKENIDNMIFLKPRLDITSKLEMFDAYIQLSDNEGFCLSIVEALESGIPVIATKLPVLKELGINTKNSILLDFDMQDIPLEKIKNIYKKKFTYSQPKDRWDKVLSKSTKHDFDLVKVKALNTYELYRIIDADLGRIPKRNEEFYIKKERLEMLLGNNDYQKAFVKKVER